MAHKHNRRRVRPRSRGSDTLHLTFNSSNNIISSSWPSLPLSSTTRENGQKSIPLPASLRNPGASLSSRHWHNRYVAWQNRDMAQKGEAVKLEAERIKLFGGEPGDDVGLCYKMLEVFGSMNWIDTVE
ncbi:hypothetical protein PV11_04423 [Exophiala sideris]|uniref:Uncharacterized protein n=1 Tax=Exophiala sideris TaxID=1016849 RepID=A0A0D1YHH1_9EURO|nr:hypothetical protein PV11_04423 [Exophiala sideris]